MSGVMLCCAHVHASSQFVCQGALATACKRQAMLGLTSWQNVDHVIETQGCKLKRALVVSAQDIEGHIAIPDGLAGSVSCVTSQDLHTHHNCSTIPVSREKSSV